MSSSNKSETNYEKPAPIQISKSDRDIIPPSTDEIPKTTNIRIIQKNGSEYSSDGTSSNNNNKSDSSFVPDSDYTPNNRTNINKTNPKSSQKQVRKKKN